MFGSFGSSAQQALKQKAAPTNDKEEPASASAPPAAPTAPTGLLKEPLLPGGGSGVDVLDCSIMVNTEDEEEKLEGDQDTAPIGDAAKDGCCALLQCMSGCVHCSVQGIHSKVSDEWTVKNIFFEALEKNYGREELLEGKHIEQAFSGSSVVSKDPEFIKRACSNALRISRQHPVPVLGRFGQGKSSLINSLVGDTRADHGRYKATTMNVDIYRMSTGQPLLGDILLCDTPGWEPGKEAKVLLQYQKALIEEGSCKGHYPDVTIFVVAGTPQGMRELSSTIEGRKLARAYAQFKDVSEAKSILLPVITFGDTSTSGEARSEDVEHVQKFLEQMRRNTEKDLTVLDPSFVSNKNKEGIEDLKKRLIDAVAGSVEHFGPWRPWFRQMEVDLTKEVKLHEEQNPQGKNHGELFERTVTAMAYSYGQDATFALDRWHLLPDIRNKLQGKSSISDACCSGRGCTVIILFLLALSLIANVFCFVAFKSETGRTWIRRIIVSGDLERFYEAPLPSQYRMNVDGMSGGENWSPIFDRGALHGAQIAYDPSGPHVRLTAPDGWFVSARFFVNSVSRQAQGTFPNISGLIVNDLVPGTSPKIAGVEVLAAAHVAPQPMPSGPMVYQWNVSSLWSCTQPDLMCLGAGSGPQLTTPQFDLPGAPALTMQFYPLGDASNQPGGERANSVYVCAGDGQYMKFRFHIDGTSRTVDHTFHNQDFFWPECFGFSSFAEPQATYSIVALELISTR